MCDYQFLAKKSPCRKMFRQGLLELTMVIGRQLFFLFWSFFCLFIPDNGLCCCKPGNRYAKR